MPRQALETAVVSYPPVLALYGEDINDAASYVGLRTLTGQFFHQPREIVAAYAGLGMGLCRSYTDHEECIREGRALPERHTLLIEYTQEAVLLQYRLMREAIELAMPDTASSANFDLGGKVKDREGYSGEVKALLKTFLRREFRLLGAPEVILVVLTGTMDSELQHEVTEIVQESVKQVVSQVSLVADDVEYVASRGAAEMSWRAISCNDARDGRAQLQWSKRRSRHPK